MSPVHAAAAPLAALTAWQALIDHAGVRRDDAVLVHGGAGGVGGFAVQLAVVLGARVTATCLGADAEYVRSLGADDVVDVETRPSDRPVVVARRLVVLWPWRSRARVVVGAPSVHARHRTPDVHLVERCAP